MLDKNSSSDRNQRDAMDYALLESFPDAVVLMDQNGLILNANTLFAAAFGRHPQECIAQSVYELIAGEQQLPELEDYLREQVEEVLCRGSRVVFAAESDVRKVTVSPLKFPDGEISRMLVTIQNISEQKRINRELHRERALKTALLDTMPCSAIILDSDLRVIVSNQYARDLMFGTTENGAGRLEPNEFFCNDDRAPLREKFLNILHSGAEESVEIEVHPYGAPQSMWLMTRSKREIIDGQPCIVSIGVDISERKLIEDELRENKSRFSYAMDAARFGIWEWDIETDELSWSDNVWALYGMKVNSLPLSHQLCVDTVHPDDRAMASHIIRSAVSEGVAASLEYRACHPDGSVHWLTSRGMPLRDDDGRITRYIGTVIDITERKEIENDLIESKARLSQALEASRAGVWEWDLITDENIWSDEIRPLYGLEPGHEKPSFQLWTSSVHPEDRESAIRAVTDAAESKSGLNVEYRVCDPDGSCRWIMARGRPIYATDGQLVSYIGTSIDITERKLLESELLKSKLMFNQALEAARVGVWEWDLKTDDVVWSDQIWSIYGLERSTTNRAFKLWSTVSHADDREITIRKVTEAVSNETALNIEYRVCHPDGSVHWILSRGRPLRDFNGQTSSYIGTIIDITERKRFEIELRESKTRLSQALEASCAGVWEWNLITDENIWSDEIWPLYGLEPGHEKPSFQLWRSSVHPEDRESASRAVTDAAQMEAELQVEYRVTHSDGSIHWLMSRGKPFRDYNNRVFRYLGTVIDITERKMIEIALEENKTRFSFALKVTNAGVWEWDMKADTLVWSDQIWLLYGLEPDSMPLSHKLCASHIHPDDRDIAFQNVMTAASKQAEINIEYRVCHSDGSIHWLMCRGMPLLYADGQTRCYIGTVMDITERKQIEVALRRSQSKLTFVLENSHVGVWDIDLQDHTARHTLEHARVFGYDTVRPDWSLEKFLGHVIAEDRDEIHALIGNAIAKLENYSFECRILSARCDLRWIWVSGAFQFDMNGKASRISGIMMDITERKNAERLVIEGKAKLEAALASMTDAVFISDTASNLNEYNDAFVEFHRFGSRQECTGSFSMYPELFDLFQADGELLPVDQWPISRALRGESATNAEYRLKRRDTGETWMGSYGFAPIRSKEGDIVGSVIVARDISEQKEIEKALRESEFKFRSIFDYAPVAIVIEDIENARLIDVNASLLQLFGYSQEELIDRSATDIGLYPGTDEREKIIGFINEHGRIINRPRQLRKRSGEIINVLYSAEFIKLDTGFSLLAMMTDVTLLKLQKESIRKLEEAVAERTKQLQQDVERMHHFLSMISHEYRTPLAIIRVNLDLIEFKNRSCNCLNRLEMTKINRAIDRLVDVMEVSIQESRVIESKTMASMIRFRIAPVIAAQLEAFRGMWSDRSVLYSEELENCEILGEPSQLKLAIYNLLDNARKYSSNDSPIELECRREGDEVVIRIRNQGVGINQDEGETFFEKYRRGSNSMNTGGAGMGLWLVRNIIDQHKGQVTLTGIASGVEAKVRLPIVNDEHEPSQENIQGI